MPVKVPCPCAGKEKKGANDMSTEDKDWQASDAGQSPIPLKKGIDEMRTEDEDLQVDDAGQSPIPLVWGPVMKML